MRSIEQLSVHNRNGHGNCLEILIAVASGDDDLVETSCARLRGGLGDERRGN